MSDGTIWSWSTTPGSNGTTINGINMAENCPSAGVNNAIRQMAASVVGSNVAIAATGTNTYAVTLVPAPTALVDGMTIQVRFTNASTSTTPTLNVNGLGAYTITKFGNTALVSGDIPAGHEAQLRYVASGTTWVLMNPFDEADNVPSATGGTFSESLIVNSGATGYALAGPINSGYKNRLLNPLMQIDQRHEGNSVTLSSGTNAFITDQWLADFTQAGAAGTTSAQRVADAPSALGANGTSLKFTMGTGHATSAGDFGIIYQNIEAYTINDFVLGAAGAATISISFWIKSSLTAPTFTLFMDNQNAGSAWRSFVKNFTLSGTSTWQKITIPNIQLDTAGTWNTGNSNLSGLAVGICFGAGSTFQGTNATWVGSEVFGTSSTTNLMATTGATVQITGAQVELGPVCTQLDFRHIQQELQLLQRYYEKSYDTLGGTPTVPGTANSNGINFFVIDFTVSAVYTAGSIIPFKVTKRVPPTVTLYSNISGASGKIYDATNGADVTGNVFTGGVSGASWDANMAVSGAEIEFEFQWTAEAGL